MSGILSQLTNAVNPTLSPFQNFRTITVPNDRTALYTLTIRSPGLASAMYQSYTFPISPRSISRTRISMANFYDTQGPSSTNGISRNIDIFGLTPEIIKISGTTGWQRHSQDSYLATGLQSIQNLEKILIEYAKLNIQQIESGKTEFYTLEFYDYFSDVYLQVEPVGQQGFSQSVNKQLYTDFEFNWISIKSVSAPIFGSTADLIGQLLNGLSSGSVFSTVSNNIASGLSGLENSASNLASSVLTPIQQSINGNLNSEFSSILTGTSSAGISSTINNLQQQISTFGGRI